MVADWKYIVFISDLGVEYPVLFPPFIGHTCMVGPDRVPISAGFIRQSKGRLIAHGSSLSLKLSSRPEDTKLLNRFISKS